MEPSGELDGSCSFSLHELPPVSPPDSSSGTSSAASVEGETRVRNRDQNHEPGESRTRTLDRNHSLLQNQ